MREFYGDMKQSIFEFSIYSNIITVLDINKLKTYKEAPPEYKKDFDDSILGGRTMSVSKSKTKRLESPFAGSSEFGGEQEITQIFDLSKNIEETNNIKQENNSPYYYKPSYIDPIDSFIA
ncbi:MAG: hypothetical protein GX032_02780 [Tenericutes bacterium]|nr:hypothetical protein [Mycoplasmatota bacterium]